MASKKVRVMTIKQPQDTDGLFQFSITGSGTVNDEMNTILDGLDECVDFGLSLVRSEFKRDFVETVENEVYARYKPKAYDRRRDYPEFGKSIEDTSNLNVYKQNKNNLTIQYIPSGQHAEIDDQYTRNGDELIRTLESGKGYPLGAAIDDNGEVLQRPFWSEMVLFYTDMGHGEAVFVKGVNYFDNSIGLIRDGNIYRDRNDTIFNEREANNRLIERGVEAF